MKKIRELQGANMDIDLVSVLCSYPYENKDVLTEEETG
jgi:hypothetical protein